MNFFEFKEEDLENMDHNEIFNLSMRSVEQFDAERIYLFINDTIAKTETIIEGYTDASVLTPNDVLAFKNLCRCSETLALVEHWIKTKMQNMEDDLILDASNEDL
jgi:hypothetical protein